MHYGLALPTGGACGDARTLAELAHLAKEAGATWWVEYMPPEIGGIDEVRKAIKQGPLRID